jgi:hypothetical protein
MEARVAMGWVKFASDYEADQRQMQATADGLQNLVSTSSTPNVDVGAWTEFYNELSIFDATPVYDLWRPFLPTPHFIATSGLADTFAAQAEQLEGWRQTITAAAGKNIPSAGAPTAPSPAPSQLASVIKTGAIAAAVVAGAIAVVEAIRKV